MSWQRYANCLGTDWQAFFPRTGATAADVAPVLAVCRRCPVRLICLEYALERDEKGIWGGMTEGRRQREGRRRQERALARQGRDEAVA